ncbi:hypothetical protein [Rummeliibacillus suwonensis]|uniref:hypothetical protein n=1 Tax=Rummeliibacillus suwonensis TaxID=1306154 RepID=UPI0028A1A529|nr:hypothetical protein [Rummeliibacillus suwonensis]
METISNTERAISMIHELESRYLISNNEACRRLGVSQINYRRWVRGDYQISNRLYNRMIVRFDDIKDVTDNTALIIKLQSQIYDIQKQLDAISGK